MHPFSHLPHYLIARVLRGGRCLAYKPSSRYPIA
jgi:hypothetical protein